MSMMTSSFTNGRTTAPSVHTCGRRSGVPLPLAPSLASFSFPRSPVISSLAVDCHAVPVPIPTPGVLLFPVPWLLFCP